MADYLIVADKEAAIARSRAEAQRRGCGPITTHWWSWIEHPEDKRAALLMQDEEDKAALSVKDKGDVKSEAALKAESAKWFPEPVFGGNEAAEVGK